MSRYNFVGWSDVISEILNYIYDDCLIDCESGFCCQLKEAGLWDSTAVVRSSSFTSVTCSPSVSPSKRLHSASPSGWTSRAHGRHVHQAGYQQLMDIINLPRPRSHSSAVLKPANCGPDAPSGTVAVSSAVGKSSPRPCVGGDASQQDEALKPTDALVQLVDTL